MLQWVCPYKDMAYFFHFCSNRLNSVFQICLSVPLHIIVLLPSPPTIFSSSNSSSSQLQIPSFPFCVSISNYLPKKRTATKWPRYQYWKHLCFDFSLQMQRRLQTCGFCNCCLPNWRQLVYNSAHLPMYAKFCRYAQYLFDCNQLLQSISCGGDQAS